MIAELGIAGVDEWIWIVVIVGPEIASGRDTEAQTDESAVLPKRSMVLVAMRHDESP